jgi:hypothetical protein
MAKAPTPPKGDDLLHTKGGGQSTPTPTTHRESGQAAVKTK